MFGSDGSPIVQYIVIFAVIFTVLAAIVFLVRRLTGGGTALQTRGARARQPRLGIVDVYELDRARQLILLRRDNVEHLLLVGGPNDVVVERNIQRGQRPLPESTLRPEPVAEPLPDPLAEAGRLPEPPRAIAEPAPRRAEPAFEMPVVVPAPVPGSAAAPPVRLPIDAGLIGGDEPGQDLPVPPPPPREAFSRGRTQRPTVPAPERTRAPEPVAEPAPVEVPVLPSLSPQPTETRSVDPKVLSDMARQLQAAIARPSSAVTPPPEAAEPPKAESLAAMMAAFDRRNDPAPVTARMPPPPVVPAPVPPIPQQAAPIPVPPPPPVVPPAPAPVVPPPPLPRTPPAAERPLPPPIPPRPEPAAPKPDPKAEKALANPFSVEEIEAEFARLLGRPLDKRG